MWDVWNPHWRRIRFLGRKTRRVGFSASQMVWESLQKVGEMEKTETWIRSVEKKHAPTWWPLHIHQEFWGYENATFDFTKKDFLCLLHSCKTILDNLAALFFGILQAQSQTLASTVPHRCDDSRWRVAGGCSAQLFCAKKREIEVRVRTLGWYFADGSQIEKCQREKGLVIFLGFYTIHIQSPSFEAKLVCVCDAKR